MKGKKYMKKWYQSKTLWFNILTTVVLTAQMVGDLYLEYATITILLAGFGNIMLRVWFTTTEIEKAVK